MPYALVTGSAKGIGKSIAKELAARQYHLLLVDIDSMCLLLTANELRTRYNVVVHTLHADLSEAGAVEKIKFWSKPYHDKLQVLVNNAGYGLNGYFDHLPLSEQWNIIDVNIKAVVGLSHAFIPVLKRADRGYLLNVASTTAYQSVPYLCIYAATKAFILSFTRGIRHELRHSGVSVSCLSPGSTDTNFVNRAGMGEKTKKTAERFNMDPDTVASIAVQGMLRKEVEIIPGFSNKLNAFLPKFFSKKFVESIAGSIYKPGRTIKQRHVHRVIKTTGHYT